MIKLIILLGSPEQFSSEYTEAYNDFLIGLDQLPGLRRKAVSSVFGGMGGRTPYSMIIEAAFDSREALEQALTSPAGVHAGQLLIQFAGRQATALFVDTLEEAYQDEPPVR